MKEIIIAIIVLGGLGTIFGLGLSWASRVFAVKIDERVSKLRDILPGANCGACGFPGCDGFAFAVADGKAKGNGCSVGGESVTMQIAEIMGLELPVGDKLVARVLCKGACKTAQEKYAYYGLDDCFAASQAFGGHKACSYGCLGHGTCVRACPFQAIVITNGVASVIQENCRSCEKCIASCPKGLIEMIPIKAQYSILCKSLDKGAITKQSCKVGCIGCGRCVKICPAGAISMKGSLAKIDPSLCTNCDACIGVCPANSIHKV